MDLLIREISLIPVATIVESIKTSPISIVATPVARIKLLAIWTWTNLCSLHHNHSHNHCFPQNILVQGFQNLVHENHRHAIPLIDLLGWNLIQLQPYSLVGYSDFELQSCWRWQIPGQHPTSVPDQHGQQSHGAQELSSGGQADEEAVPPPGAASDLSQP
jgi:hypothetical protein